MSRVTAAHALKLAGLMALAALASCSTSRQLQQPPETNPGPSRTQPVPDTNNPTAPGPQGSLPNPYVNPQ